MFEKLVNLIKETLFPVYCVECGREGEWWCDECLSKQDNYSGEFDVNELLLDGAFAFAPYSEQRPIGKLIRAFKYNFASDIENVLEKIIVLNNNFENFTKRISAENCLVIPIPLHSRRERERGYNQAGVIARIIAKNYGRNKIVVEEKCLSRVRYTIQQAKLNKKEREQNVCDAFVWARNEKCPENIILVDDVFTTGATLESCAKALRTAGAKKVFAVTLARAVFSISGR